MKRVTCLAIVCCAIGIGACGGDDDDDGGSDGGAAVTTPAATTPATTPTETTPTTPADDPVETTPEEPTTTVPAGEPLSAAELRAGIRDACGAAEEASDKVEAPENIQDAALAADYLGKLDEIAQTQLAALKRLTPPADLEAKYKTLLEKEEQATTLLAGAAAKARARDRSGLQDLQRIGAIGDEIDDAGDALGVDDC